MDSEKTPDSRGDRFDLSNRSSGRNLLAALSVHVVRRSVSAVKTNTEVAIEDVGKLLGRVMSDRDGNKNELSVEFHQLDERLIGEDMVKLIALNNGEYIFEIREGATGQCQTRVLKDTSIISLDKKFFIALGDGESVDLVYLEEDKS